MSPPPTSIDGTDITGATIDGQEVQEITVDGQTVFTSDLTRVIEMIDDFEDNDTTTLSTDWDGWNTNNFGSGTSWTAQNSTVINGNFSGEFESVSSFPEIETVRTSETTNPIQMKIRISADVGNSSDRTNLTLKDASDTRLGDLVFRDGNGAVEWLGSNVLNSWDANENYTIVFDFDFPNDQLDIFINGTNEGTFPFLSSVNGVAKVTPSNDTNTSGATRSVFFDDVAEVTFN
jgi:hypothetical protein